MSSRCVTVLGGTGFVGTALAWRLAESFHEVRILTRRAARVRDFKVLPNVNVVETKVHDAQALSDAIAGSDVVINLVGILNQTGNASTGSFENAHVALSESVMKACLEHKVPRVLHMSALNADAENGGSEYLRSKGRAEAHVSEIGESLAWTMFRPSVIFGERDAFFNRFSALLRALPVFPLAAPDARMAPVWIGDVCRTMIDSIDDESTYGQAIHLCGPKSYSLKELVEYTADIAGMQRKVIGLPARSMELVPGKPLSMDNFNSLQTDSVCPGDCELQPTSIESVVPSYLGRDGWTGRLQTRRESARR